MRSWSHVQRHGAVLHHWAVVRQPAATVAAAVAAQPSPTQATCAAAGARATAHPRHVRLLHRHFTAACVRGVAVSEPGAPRHHV